MPQYLIIGAVGLALAFGGARLLRALYRWMFTDSSAPPDPDEPVVIAEPDSEMQAQIVRSKLEAFGIKAVARNTASIGMYMPQMYGTWEVLVRYADVDEARACLDREE